MPVTIVDGQAFMTKKKKKRPEMICKHCGLIVSPLRDKCPSCYHNI